MMWLPMPSCSAAKGFSCRPPFFYLHLLCPGKVDSLSSLTVFYGVFTETKGRSLADVKDLSRLDDL